MFLLPSYQRNSHSLLNPKPRGTINDIFTGAKYRKKVPLHNTGPKDSQAGRMIFKCFWSSKEEITAFYIHILYSEWLQTNLRESAEYWLVWAWELIPEYVIRKDFSLIKPLLTPPWFWWNLNCLFPLPLPLWEAWQGIIPHLLMMDDATASGSAVSWGYGRDGQAAEHGLHLRPAGPASTPRLYHQRQQLPPFISSHPWGFNIMMLESVF